MTPPPVVVHPETDLGELGRAFEVHGLEAIPVADAHGTLIGVVRKLALRRLRQLDPGHRSTEDPLVRGLMSPRPVAVEPDTPLDQVLERMIRTRQRSLPVAAPRTRELIGLVSRRDVLRGIGTGPRVV